MSSRLVSKLANRLQFGLAGLLTGLLTFAAWPSAAADSLSDETRAIVSRCRDAVVKIEATDKDGLLRGTGFFIDPDGTLLTSFSVGGDSSEISVIQGETRKPARRLTGDLRSGIAILKLKSVGTPTPFLPMAKSTDAAAGAPVFSLAYSLDQPVSANMGKIAGFNLKYQDRYFAVMHIRADVPVHRGEGGAPLLNMRGEVVGVIISGVEEGASCFALPIQAAEKVHRDYVRFGGPHPGRLGVMLHEGVKAVQGSTVVVLRLENDAPALRAGIQRGDVILRVGQSVIHAPEDVQNASFYLTAGEPVPVTVCRDNQTLTIQVEPAERFPLSYRLPGGQALSHPPTEDITLRVP